MLKSFRGQKACSSQNIRSARFSANGPLRARSTNFVPESSRICNVTVRTLNGPVSHTVQIALFQVALTFFDGNKLPELSFQRLAKSNNSQETVELQCEREIRSQCGRLYNLETQLSYQTFTTKVVCLFHLYLIEQNGCFKKYNSPTKQTFYKAKLANAHPAALVSVFVDCCGAH